MAMKPKMSRISTSMEADLFHAVINDDVVEFEHALTLGQDVNEQRESMLDMTPVHLACIYNSHKCMASALATMQIDPWVRDRNLRLAFDHARARNNSYAMTELHKLLYPASPWLTYSPPAA